MRHDILEMPTWRHRQSDAQTSAFIATPRYGFIHFANERLRNR